VARAFMSPRDIDRHLHYALLNQGEVGVLHDLLSRKADPNMPTEHQEVPLAIALERGSYCACRLLLVCQADPTAASVQVNLQPARVLNETVCQSSSLVHAWASCDMPVVLRSLDEALFEAASIHDAALIGLALSTIDVIGGDSATCVLTEVDSQGNSLLHVCAKGCGSMLGDKEHFETMARLSVRVLLASNIHVDVRNQAGETPLIIALRRMYCSDFVNCISDPDAVMEPARILLESRAEVNQVSPVTNMTVILEAASLGYILVCNLLLDFKADPLLTDSCGKTAIDAAATFPELNLLLRTAVLNRSYAELALLHQGSKSTTRSSIGEHDRVTQVFSMHHDEPCEVGEVPMFELLNQLDIEDSYDGDWLSLDH